MNQYGDDLPTGLLFFLIFGMLGVGALFLTRRHQAGMRFQLRLFLYSYVFRFALSLVIYEVGLVNVLGDEDSSGWVRGYSLARIWQHQGVGLLELPSILAEAFLNFNKGRLVGYYYMIGGLFYITDSPARLAAAALNCLFGALTVVFAYRIARELFSAWVAVRVGWLVCLLPSMIIWSAQTVKEPIVILLETIAIYGCVRLKLTGFSTRYILLCGLAILLLAPFRFYAVYIAGAAIVLALILPQFGKRKLTLISGVGIAAIVVPILIISGVLAQHEALFNTYDLDRIEQTKYYLSLQSGSGVESNYDLQTPEGFGVATAVGAAHLLLAPFPWQLGGGSLRMALTLPELVVWWWLFFVGVLPGLWFTIRKRFSDIQPLLFFSIGMGLLYSVTFGNIGLVYRQRAQMLPWLLIFAVVGLEQRAIRRQAARKPQMAGQPLVQVNR